MTLVRNLTLYSEIKLHRFSSSPLVEGINFAYELKIHNKNPWTWHIIYLKISLKDILKERNQLIPVEIDDFPRTIPPASSFTYKRILCLKHQLGNILCEAMIYNSTHGFKVLYAKRDLVGLPFLN